MVKSNSFSSQRSEKIYVQPLLRVNLIVNFLRVPKRSSDSRIGRDDYFFIFFSKFGQAQIYFFTV